MAPKKDQAKKVTTEEAEKKRKADAAAEEPAKKEAKTEDKPKVESVVAKDEKVEHEKDAAKDTRPTLQEPVSFRACDSTINTVSTLGGKVLMTLSEGGMQYLIAGARANVGLKAGRYLYEVRIVESHNDDPKAKSGPARQILRLGFSSAGSSLVLGDNATEHVHFDSDGYFRGGGKQTPLLKFAQQSVVLAVVLNLDPSSPNANTVSLFKNGERLSQPQAIPENLHGKTLFPHIAFRGFSVEFISETQPFKPLGFQCRTVAGAAKADTVPAAAAPKVFDVLLPVGFPDEGTFDWLDGFLAKNPQYVELSDRMLQSWASSSGLNRPRPVAGASMDKPNWNYGVPGMEDFSIRRVINNIAPAIPRHYVIMEVRSNLMASERAQILKRFSAPHFKVSAKVVMGEPTKPYKTEQLAKLLKAKQDKNDTEFKVRKENKDRKKQEAIRQKKIAEMRKKAEEDRKRAFDAAQKLKAEATAKAEGKDAEAKPEVEEKPAEAEAEKPAEDVPMKEAEPEEEEDQETEPAKAELTEEEQKLWFLPRTNSLPDLSPPVLDHFFAHFSIPAKSEGFAEVTFEWDKDVKANAYLKKWVLEKKRTSRIEELEPSQWFKDKSSEWLKLSLEWQAKQKAFEATPAGKKLEEKKGEKSDGKGVETSGVEDVCDTGNGEPLFAKFSPEDWALLQLRYELYLLQRAFTLDVNDPDRIGITDEHLAFYYTKYFRKLLNTKAFNVDTNAALADLVKDTVSISTDNHTLTSNLSEDTDSLSSLLKLTEERRRERQRRVDAGDETAVLKFTVPVVVPQVAVPFFTAPAGKGPQAGKGYGKGGKGK